MSRDLGWKEFGQPQSNAPRGGAVEEPQEAPAPAAGGPEPATRPQPEGRPADRLRRQAAAPSRGGPARLEELVWLCLAVVDAFLAMDFLLQAVGALGGGFVEVVERVGNTLAGPFSGVFYSQTPPRLGHTELWYALVAIVVYTLAAWILLRLLRLLAPPGYRRAPRG